MKFKALLAASVASLLTAGAIALAQTPGVNNNFPVMWNMVWEASTTKPTYSATSLISTATSAKEICALSGSTTRTIRVRRLVLAGIGGAVQTEMVGLERYTSNFSGAGTAMTAVANDSQSAAATASIEQWNANPTNTGGAGLLLEIPFVWSNATTGVGVPINYDFGIRGSAIVLRGATQWVAATFLGQTGAGASVACTWTWTEESP